MEEPKPIATEQNSDSNKLELKPALPSQESFPIVESPISPIINPNTDTNHDATPVPNGSVSLDKSSASSADKLENGNETGDKLEMLSNEIEIEEEREEQMVKRDEQMERENKREEQMEREEQLVKREEQIEREEEREKQTVKREEQIEREDKREEQMEREEKREKQTTVKREEQIESVRKKALENVEKNVKINRGIIDTRAPFESVKEAVSKFGGITDWKAHKALTLERSKQIKLELEKLHQEIPIYKTESESAELKKAQILSELESTKHLIENLKLNLEKAQTEESQAKQDSELAKLRAEEISQGIINEELSVASKAQLDLANSRYQNAIKELESVKSEFSKLQEEYSSLIIERDLVVKRANEAVLESKEIEKKVEELTLELIFAKETLELSHSAHLEAEEHRVGASLAREQDCFIWERELKEREEEFKVLSEKSESTKELRIRLNEGYNTLEKLKAELAAYMESKLNEEINGMTGTEDTGTSEALEMKRSIEEALKNTRKELEEVKGNIDKAKIEVEILKAASGALKSEMENEKMTLLTLQQREGMASIAVSSLEAELERTKEELEVVRSKERETREKMVELPKMLQQAAQEADEAKFTAQLAQEELKRAKEDLNHSKTTLSTTEIRIKATLKEIEASKASEKLALDAINALQETEHQTLDINSPKGINLPLEEYYGLSKKAHEAEESAHDKVENALAQIEAAKEAESKCLERLNEVYKEVEKKRESMRVALERAETAKEGKLGAEMELRKWRAENEKKRRANEALAKMGSVNPVRSPSDRSGVKIEEREEINELVQQEMDQKMAGERKLRRRKSFFPRVIMYIARKKAEAAAK